MGSDLLNVVTFTAVDPDPDNTEDPAITWSLRGEDASDFTNDRWCSRLRKRSPTTRRL